MLLRSSQIVLTPSDSKPYKVVLLCETRGWSEYPVATIREGEALIRGNLPTPVDPRPNVWSADAAGIEEAGDQFREFGAGSDHAILRKRALSRWDNEGGALGAEAQQVDR